MGRKLLAHTVIPGPVGHPEPFVVLGPDDDVPEWATELIGEHLYEPAVDAEVDSGSGAQETPKSKGDK